MTLPTKRPFFELNWWIVFVILLAATATGLMFSVMQEPVYQSITVLGFDIERAAFSQQSPDPGYFCVFAENPEIVSAAVGSLQLPDAMAGQRLEHHLLSSVKCDPHPRSGQIELRVGTVSPVLASDLANAIIATSFELISAQYDGLSLRIDSSVVDQQSLLAAAFPLNLLVGLISGLIVGGITLVIQDMLEARKALMSSPSLPSGLVSPPKAEKVLIIEHMRYLGEQLVRQVSTEGYQVRHCFDGPESLLVAETWKPDLVLVEETLPEMDGFHIIEIMRKLGATAHVPIILIADQGNLSAWMLAYESGADDWLAKPIDLAELSLRIGAHIRRTKRFADQQRGTIEVVSHHRKFPFANKRLLSVLSRELRARGASDQLAASLAQVGLEHIVRPNYARQAYVGPDVIALPVLDDDVKIATYKKLEWRKRLFDLTLASVGLLFLSPVLALIAFAIYLRMGRPVFFRQTRPGLSGAPFQIFKFRTMTNDRDENGELLPDEDRFTSLGLFLRHTSLDELPELLNVLTGEMSFVGPRPLLMQYLELYSPEQNRRNHVWPGITGWAQVNGRNMLSWEEKFKLDVWYVDNRSLWLDIKTIWMTIKSVLLREGISHEVFGSSYYFRGNSQETLAQSQAEDTGKMVEKHTVTRSSDANTNVFS